MRTDESAPHHAVCRCDESVFSLAFPRLSAAALLVTAALFAAVPAARDAAGTTMWLAAILTICVIVHEGGHWLVGRRLGLDLVMRVGPIVGYVRPRNTCGGRPTSTADLDWRQRVAWYGAGPAANVAVAVALHGASRLGPLSSMSRTVAGVSLAIGLVNLLPIEPLDGGRIASAFASALPGPHGWVAEWAVTLAGCSAAATICALSLRTAASGSHSWWPLATAATFGPITWLAATQHPDDDVPPGVPHNTPWIWVAATAIGVIVGAATNLITW